MAKKNVTAIEKSEPTKTALAPWQQEALAEANADAAKFQQGTERISFKNGRPSIDGEFTPDGKLKVVIIEAIFGKAYYDKPYDPNTPVTPVCYAFSAEDNIHMAPHEAAPDKQNETCAGCQWNKFGTALKPDGSKGKGKRCKDEVRIMCAVYNPDPKAMMKGEFRMASIPPGSLKNWGNYVTKLRNVGRAFKGVVTEIGTEPYGGAYALTFNMLSDLTEDQYRAFKGRSEAAKSDMMQPYPVLGEEEPKEEPVQTKKRARKVE